VAYFVKLYPLLTKLLFEWNKNPGGAPHFESSHAVAVLHSRQEVHSNQQR